MDENQLKRHYLKSDLDELYRLDVDEYDAGAVPLYTLPEEDQLLANVFLSMKDGELE